MGTQVVVAYRDEDEKRRLKPMGDLGQVVSMVSGSSSCRPRLILQEWDIRNEEQIAECVKHSDIVFNLTGRDYETKYVIFGRFSIVKLL